MHAPKWLGFGLVFLAANAFGANSSGNSGAVAVNSEPGKAGTKSADTPSASSTTGASPLPSGKSSARSAVIAEKVKAAMWAKLRVGQTKAEVAALLGEPNIKSAAKWFYSGAGWVTFSEQGVSTGFGT